MVKVHSKAKNTLPLEHDSRVKRFLGWAVYVMLIGLASGFAFFVIMIGVFSVGLPDVRDFDQLAGIESTLVMDREGGMLYAIYGEENRTYVPLEKISQYLQDATVAIEDDQFFEHSGFDIPGIVKAVCHEALGNLFGLCPRRGGSTITQQLAKNAFLSTARSYVRKTRELILSVRLENSYDKEKILELYLNRIPYGGNAYGAELASQVFFGKSAKELDIAEGAIMASLPKAPSFYSPFGEYAYSKLDREFTLDEIERRTIKTVQDLTTDEYTIGLVGKEVDIAEGKKLYIPGRVDTVLRRMADLNFIAEEERAAAVKETHEIEFKRYRANIKAAHFVFYVRRLVEERFGKDALEQGGLKITTTIDPKLQEAAEEIIAKQVPLNEVYGATNAALLSVDAKTGEILTMVGSADYFNDEIDGKVNMTLGLKQPGSSFKPFVYAKAFLNRYAPATILYDTPTDFGGGYRPSNFNDKFEGPMSIRRALGQSRNIPAIKAYFLAGQEDEILPFVETLGIEGIVARKPVGGFGPSLAIGTSEVRLIDMVKAYSVFANGGMRKDLVPILKIEDRNEKVLYEWKESDIKEIPVLDPQVAYLITDILSDERVKLGSSLSVSGHKVAAKTGTSNKELRKDVNRPTNLWVFGYTPGIVTGVWVGNADGKELTPSASGGAAASPIFHNFMVEVLKEMTPENFPVPEGIKEVRVSKASGLLPGPNTPEDQMTTDKFASFSIPTEIDTSFTAIIINKTTGQPADLSCSQYNTETKTFQNHHDPIDTFASWEAGIREWVTRYRAEHPEIPDFPPRAEPVKVNADDLPTITISEPPALTTIDAGQTDVRANVSAPLGIDRVEFYLADKVNFIDKDAPFDGKVRVTQFMDEGVKKITARVFDTQGCTGESSIEVEVKK